MSEAYKTITDANFEREVLQADKPVVLDFWAEWCPPCHRLAPVFEDLAREYAGKMIFAKLDTDANPDTAMRYGIQGIPALIFFNGGKPVEQLVGARPRNDLKQHIDQVLSLTIKRS